MVKQSDPRSFDDGYVSADAFEAAALASIAAAGGLVIDAGGGARFTKGMKRFETLFANVDYRTLDIAANTGPDIVADIQNLPFEDGVVDAFICRSVLEHVRSPDRAVSEMARTLKPGGLALITVPSIYPYHARPGPGGYPDLWRFFEDTIRMLLADFSEVVIARTGGPATAVVMFVPFLNSRGNYLRPVAARVDRVFSYARPRTNATVLLVWAKK